MLALNVTYEVRMCTHRCPQPTAMHGRRQPVMARWRPKSAPVPPPPAFSGWRAARAPAARVLPSPAAQPAGNLPPSLFHATLCACCFIFRVFCSSFCIVSSIFRGFLSALWSSCSAFSAPHSLPYFPPGCFPVPLPFPCPHLLPCPSFPLLHPVVFALPRFARSC